MARLLLTVSALVVHLSFAASAFADSRIPPSSPTNPTPGFPCTEQVEPL